MFPFVLVIGFLLIVFPVRGESKDRGCTVTVKFHDHLVGRRKVQRPLELDHWFRQNADTVRPTFQRKSPALDSFFDVRLKSDVNCQRAERELASFPIIENVSGEEGLVLLSLQETPDLVPLEFHLAPPVVTGSWTSGGVDVQSAWQLPGGKGEEVTIVDFEKGWNLAHEDLPPGIELLSGVISSDLFSQDHGTKVLGVLGAVENDHGVTGMVPEATLKVAAPEPGKKLASILDSLVSQLSLGDVLLFEVGSSKCPLGLEEDCQYGVPVETIASVFAVLQEATAKGVIVIEAAGNSALDMDDPAFVWENEVGDSGAIIVGAGIPGTLLPTASSNYGSRVDVQGFGEGLVTTAATYGELGYPKGDVNNAYTESLPKTSPNYFSDTSSAAAVVAGVVTSLQGIAKAKNGVALFPEQVRSILVQTGIKQGEPDSGESEKHIGPLPNLGQALSMISDYSPPPPPPPSEDAPSPPDEPIPVEDDDQDDDGIPNAQDNCPKTANPSQEDPNKNGKGYACDSTENAVLQWFSQLQKCLKKPQPSCFFKEGTAHHLHTLWDKKSTMKWSADK